jgi:hypothetical protein
MHKNDDTISNSMQQVNGEKQNLQTLARIHEIWVSQPASISTLKIHADAGVFAIENNNLYNMQQQQMSTYLLGIDDPCW